MRKSLFALVLSLTAATTAFAQFDDEAYFEIASDTTTELAVSPLEVQPVINSEIGSAIDEAHVILDKIILLGKKAWSIVEAGKPVANFTSARADLLPYGITTWQQLAGWQIPVSRRYERKIHNKYGANVVHFRYRIIYNWGGNMNGKGAYLMGITVYPEIVDVAWGWKFDAKASIPTVANAGSTVNPMAAAEVLISSQIRTPLTHLDNTESYYVRGDGFFVDLQK